MFSYKGKQNYKLLWNIETRYIKNPTFLQDVSGWPSIQLKLRGHLSGAWFALICCPTALSVPIRKAVRSSQMFLLFLFASYLYFHLSLGDCFCTVLSTRRTIRSTTWGKSGFQTVPIRTFYFCFLLFSWLKSTRIEFGIEISWQYSPLKQYCTQHVVYTS